ncbi:MAG TPA: hypothetical protein VN688_20110 [Gemmataceae bacterium]|nr:hypothetical protein [Gemmataceae bacterium]
MSENEQEWFIVERGRALARMHLTRRDDLIVTEAGKDVGLDYLVYITKADEKPSVRQFGLALRSTRNAVTEEKLSKVLRPTMQALLRVGDFPYPVCLFSFTMEDNQGYSTWIAEPVLTEDGKPRLRMHSAASCTKLDRAALDRIVNQVDAWYDAFFSSIVISA